MISGHETTKYFGDFASISTVIATVLGWLPALAAFLSIIWTLIRIYETKTIQKLLGKENISDDKQLD